MGCHVRAPPCHCQRPNAADGPTRPLLLGCLYPLVGCWPSMPSAALERRRSDVQRQRFEIIKRILNRNLAFILRTLRMETTARARSGSRRSRGSARGAPGPRRPGSRRGPPRAASPRIATTNPCSGSRGWTSGPTTLCTYRDVSVWRTRCNPFGSRNFLTVRPI